MGFCEKWISWIKTCLESLFVSVLINGIPTKEFIPQKGLRQGEPLVLFLFLIVVEGLTGVLRNVVELNLVESLEIEVKKVKINMVQFADDTLFFCKASYKSVFSIKVILNCFELASGLKVNFSKSIIGGVGVDMSLIRGFSAMLNCDVMKSPFKYLRMHVGECHKRAAFWVGVLDIIKSRLGRWKGRFLSLAGRICLIKSILSSIPLFYVSLYKVPSLVLKEIVKLQRNFLWG